MKLSIDSHVYINCRTDQEKEMMLDIFESIGITWRTRTAPRTVVLYSGDMRFLIEDKYIYEGHGCLNKNVYRNGIKIPVIEARDFRNQWISIKNGLDKCVQ